MNIVVEKQPKCVATLRVEIPSERVGIEHAKIAKGYIDKARIPGFRPGKAPRSVVEKRFQKEITEQLHEVLFDEAFQTAMKQESLRVLEFGMPNDVTTHADGSISFVSQLMLAPEVQLPEYKHIAVTVPPVEVPEADFEAQLTALQERFAEFNDIADRAAEMGDFAIIDYIATVDGQSTDDFLGRKVEYLSGRTDFWVRLNEDSFLPGFAAQLVGLKPGDTKDIAVTMPEDFPIEELRAKELVFQTTLKELKTAVLPELNDEFASRLAAGKTLAELKDVILENMGGERRRKIDDMKVTQIMAHMNSLVDFELPEDLINQETQSQADAIVQRGVRSGMSEEEIQTQQEAIFDNAGQQAVANLRTNFLLQEIARKEGITVTDMELASHLAQIAESKKLVFKKFIKDLQRADKIPGIRSSILVGKTIDFLIEHANVAESNETPIDA